MEPVLSGGVASRLLPSPALSRPLKRPAFGLTAPRSGRREPLDARAAARSLAALSRPGSSVRNGLACAGAWVPGAISAVRTVGTTVPTAGRVFARVELATDLEGAGAARATPYFAPRPSTCSHATSAPRSRDRERGFSVSALPAELVAFLPRPAAGRRHSPGPRRCPLRVAEP